VTRPCAERQWLSYANGEDLTTTPPVTREVRELLFRYEKHDDLAVAERALDAAEGQRRVHFTITSTHGQRVPGILTTPVDGAPYPLVVMQHGAGSHKDDVYIAQPAEYWAGTEGWAVLSTDAPYHGERALFASVYAWRDHAVQTVQDLMRALDYASTRPELDMNRVAYIGFSMGTILGVAFVALDQRIKTAVFTIGGSMSGTRLERFGGDDGNREQLRGVATLIDPAAYAPLVSPRPVLMINGRKDEVVPAEAGERLFAAFGEPKRIEWYDGGHFGMTGSQFKTMREFLREAM
jgi:uncharacterized protein